MTDDGRAIALRIDAAPAKEMLGLGSRWWRWQHHTRENWTRRTAHALDETGVMNAGCAYRLLSVHVDWGTRRPMLDEQGIRALFREIARGLIDRGLTLDRTEPCPITQAHSGQGRGMTLIRLERVCRAEERDD